MPSVITTITGLQNLPNLQTFTADFNALQTVDLSGLTNLTFVDISDCSIPGLGGPSLTSVNVTGCTALTDFRVDDSDFSVNGISSIIGLSDLTNLQELDIDGCGLVGSINMSGLPSLIFLDMNGNGNLTELIIADSQPIGDINGNDCAFTQASLDTIITTLSQNGISNGEVDITGAGNGIISETTVPAVRTLSDSGWSVNLNSYSTYFNVTNTYPSQSEACTDVGTATFGYNAYVYSGSVIQSGSYVYNDQLLVTPKSDGWFGLSDNGNVYLVSGSGLIVSQSSCV